jgi:ankyrin repeat protein
MDASFHPAISAIKSDDVRQLRELVRQNPSLATGRSTTSHPTLLQCLVLDRKGSPDRVEMATVLIDAGADLNEPLIACGSCDNLEVAGLLLDRGAAVNGTGGWSPLEEALYWNSQGVKDLLLRRGASIHNLRIAAGLGRKELIASFFDGDGNLKPEAGKVNWPWGDVDAIEQSALAQEVKDKLTSRIRSWANDNQDILNNAFIYACMHGHIEAATLLLEKGAQINAIPGGFDFAGTALHYAALNGYQGMTQFLVERGADPNIKDTKIGGTPAGWAEYAGHLEIRHYLGQFEGSRSD